MEIKTFEEASKILEMKYDSPVLHEKAIDYLVEHPNDQAIQRLVLALQDDDFGVRWMASLALAKLGKKALIAVLEALTDPHRVGDSRLRAGAYRMLEHMNLPEISESARMLMPALKGPAADICSMEAAFIFLQELKKSPVH